MIKQKFIVLIIIFGLIGCSNNENSDNIENSNNPVDSKTPQTIVEIGADSLQYVDENTEPLDSAAEEAYKNDLSLEIKTIKEEIEDPISEECSVLLEEYASAIRSYDELMKKIDANPDDFNLMMLRDPQEENLDSYATMPQFFNCSQNKAFKKQFDILNEKKDKLLYN